MVIDTSALISIFFEEEDHAAIEDVIKESEVSRLSVASYLETSMVIQNRKGSHTVPFLDTYISLHAIKLESVTVEQIQVAQQAFARYGKGRHPAALNFGDCFTYALAKTKQELLLFKGNDFSQTDLPRVPF